MWTGSQDLTDVCFIFNKAMYSESVLKINVFLKTLKEHLMEEVGIDETIISNVKIVQCFADETVLFN